MFLRHKSIRDLSTSKANHALVHAMSCARRFVYYLAVAVSDRAFQRARQEIGNYICPIHQPVSDAQNVRYSSYEEGSR